MPDSTATVPQAGVRPRVADAGPFRLLRYYTLATLLAFALVGLTLFALQRMEERFFAQVQREQAEFLARAQAELAQQQEEAARASLIAVHEAGHLNLTRLMANLLWSQDVAPLVAAAQKIPVDHCRALDASGPAAAARRDCFAEVGRRIMALPGFRRLDADAYAAMRASTVFKVKVFDLRGVTVYSSEHRQVGEDALGNAGWRAAAQGRPASELTHRDRFSAFEGVVENRDLISTYVPVRAPGSDRILGVFEIYSDVTPFLDQVKAASRRFAEIGAGNEARVARAARANQQQVSASSDQFLLIVGGLLATLYAASLLIVRRGQRIIDRQWRAQQQAALREQAWHREKMAALAAMADNVAHEVGNPLAVIAGLVQDLAERAPADPLVAGHARMMLEQTARIAAMMRQIAAFAGAPATAPEPVDVDAAVKAVCDFLGFERAFRHLPIEFSAAGDLPPRRLVPDHLNEIAMNVLHAWAAALPADAGMRLRVQTARDGDEVLIRVGAAGGDRAGALRDALRRVLADPRVALARRRIEQAGGRLIADGEALTIALPPA